MSCFPSLRGLHRLWIWYTGPGTEGTGAPYSRCGYSDLNNCVRTPGGCGLISQVVVILSLGQLELKPGGEAEEQNLESRSLALSRTHDATLSLSFFT